MKVKPNKKHFILLIVYILTLVIIIKDIKTIVFNGASYTWFGAATGFIIMLVNVYLYVYYINYTNKKSVSAHNRKIKH